MSRLANKSIPIPEGVGVSIHPDYAEIKGPKKTVQVKIYPQVEVKAEANEIHVSHKDKNIKLNDPMVGTIWSLLKNTLTGVSEGFKLKLELVGVGYRAQAKGSELNLTLGFSHPVVYTLPEDVVAETPAQTEIVLSSHDNQLLGQVAAEIRSYRFPECYKGKGIKFAGQVIALKETKKK
jgi:large subunit ribosomal protein L6